MAFSRQEYWSSLPFLSPVNHLLSELSTMICLSWVPLHTMAHRFIEFTRLWSMWSFWLAFCDCDFCSGGCGTVVLASSVCPLMGEDKRLVQAFWWEGLALGKMGSCSSGQGYAQFSSAQSISCVQLFATPRTVACQASLSFINSQS